jgi:hypothetical protein
MARVLYAMAGAVIALAPLTAMASPSPSPTLDAVLAAAPNTDFVEVAISPDEDEGPFNATEYAAAFVGNPADTQKSLANYGFIAGYGRTWINLKAKKVLIEEVAAFAGGRGAKGWLAETGLGAMKNPSYEHPDPIDGIDSANGAHFHYSSGSLAYEDDFGFVKGNDYFYVHVESANDDGAALGANQARTQFAFAPSSTIPASDWPENSGTNSVIGRILLLGAVAIGAVLSLIARSRRQQRVGAPGPNAAVPNLQLSPDGRHWWDGQEWKSAEQWVPPGVQRSPDGRWWWDGHRWRSIPALPRLHG